VAVPAAAPRLSFIFVLFAPGRRKQEEKEMAQYKRILYETVENTEVARKSYLEYERSRDLPDEAEAEAGWHNTRKSLYEALARLSSRQRKILAMIAVDGLTETEAAQKLGLNQSTVSRHYHAARKKMLKIMNKSGVCSL